MDICACPRCSFRLAHVSAADRYPFLLPNLVGAICALAVLVLVITYLPETKDNAPAATQHRALLQFDG